MYCDKRSITNTGPAPLPVWIEPWAEEFQIPPGSEAVFIAESSCEGRLEVLEEGQISVFAWSGANMTIEIEGITVWASYASVPPLPSGMSVRQFLDVVGLKKEDE